MLKRDITYEDFNGDTVTETFYFNISKPELIQLEVEQEGGLRRYLERIIETSDRRKMIEEMKRLVLLAYGKKSDDGKHFVKTDDLRTEFEHHAAYPVLFMELATDDKAAAAFLIGALPKDLSKDLEKELDKPVVDAPSV